jgi:hypothetical protein
MFRGVERTGEALQDLPKVIRKDDVGRPRNHGYFVTW